MEKPSRWTGWSAGDVGSRAKPKWTIRALFKGAVDRPADGRPCSLPPRCGSSTGAPDERSPRTNSSGPAETRFRTSSERARRPRRASRRQRLMWLGGAPTSCGQGHHFEHTRSAGGWMKQQRFRLCQAEEKIQGVCAKTWTCSRSPAHRSRRTLYMSLSGVREMSLITHANRRLCGGRSRHSLCRTTRAVRSAIRQDSTAGAPVFLRWYRGGGDRGGGLKRCALMLPGPEAAGGPRQIRRRGAGERHGGLHAVKRCDALHTIIESGLDIPRDVNTDPGGRLPTSLAWPAVVSTAWRVGRIGVASPRLALSIPAMRPALEAARPAAAGIQEFRPNWASVPAGDARQGNPPASHLLGGGAERPDGKTIGSDRSTLEMLQESSPKSGPGHSGRGRLPRSDLPNHAFIPADVDSPKPREDGGLSRRRRCGGKGMLELAATGRPPTAPLRRPVNRPAWQLDESCKLSPALRLFALKTENPIWCLRKRWKQPAFACCGPGFALKP